LSEDGGVDPQKLGVVLAQMDVAEAVGQQTEENQVLDGERFRVTNLAKWRDGADKVTIATFFGYASER
jgi:hypothetical protein